MSSLIKYYYKNFKFNISTQLWAFILTVLYSVAVILSPIASQYLINKVLNTTDVGNLQIGIFIFFAACILQPIIGLLRDIVFVKMNLKISSSISKRMFEKVMSAKMSFYDNTRNGDVISRINNDGNAISSFFSGFFIVYVKDALVILFIVIGMFYMSIKITLIICILLSLNLLVNKAFDSKFKNVSSQIAKNNDSVFSYTNQAINSIITIKTFTNEEKIKNEYNEIVDKVVFDNQKKQLLNIYMNNINNFIGIMSLAIIYGFGALEILNGNMTIGSVIGLGLYFQLILSPLGELVNNNVQLSSIKPIFKRLREYIDLEEENYNEKNISINKNENLQIKNVTFSYKNIKILDKVNANFPNRGLVAIVGESGVGKSTLIKLLLKFYEPNSGDIYIGDNSFANLNVITIRNYIGLVNQDVTLFNRSIEDNIRYANEHISHEEVVSICKKVNIHENITKFEKGYDTIISEKLNLSGGEKQRLGIVMTLAKNPEILILDEPTSSLDAKNEQIIMNVLESIAKEKLVILISHKDSSIKFAEKVYILENKKLYLRNDCVIQNG